MTLPHRYPFRLVERVEGEAVRLAASAGAFWGRGEPQSAAFWVERFAQAAALLWSTGGTGRTRLLAGVESATVHREIVVGDYLEIHAGLEGRVAGLARIRGEARDASGLAIASAVLYLSEGAE